MKILIVKNKTGTHLECKLRRLLSLRTSYLHESSEFQWFKSHTLLLKCLFSRVKNFLDLTFSVLRIHLNSLESIFCALCLYYVYKVSQTGKFLETQNSWKRKHFHDVKITTYTVINHSASVITLNFLMYSNTIIV